MASSASVGTFPCLGGCGRSLDPEAYPNGVCPDCDERFGGPEGL